MSTFERRRPLAASAVSFALLVAPACNAVVGDLRDRPADGATGEGKGSGSVGPATVYISSTIGPSQAFASMPCQLGTMTNQLEIGSSSIGGGVKDGTQSTSVSCSVTPGGGSAFAVTVKVVGNGGGFTVSGTMPATGTGTGITASLEYGQVGAPVTYNGTNCSVMMEPSSTAGGPAIKPGAVWATVTCDDMTVRGQPGHVCEGILIFRMENCVGSP